MAWLCNELLMELEEKKAIRLLRFEPDYQDRALIEGVCVCRGQLNGPVLPTSPPEGMSHKIQWKLHGCQSI